MKVKSIQTLIAYIFEIVFIIVERMYGILVYFVVELKKRILNFLIIIF